jgi:hypothetical protein
MSKAYIFVRDLYSQFEQDPESPEVANRIFDDLIRFVKNPLPQLSDKNLHLQADELWSKLTLNIFNIISCTMVDELKKNKMMIEEDPSFRKLDKIRMNRLQVLCKIQYIYSSLWSPEIMKPILEYINSREGC